MKARIPVVDLFAGPGGLGEGFASHADDLEIVLSAEADPWAHRTLQLRALYRHLGGNASASYQDMVKTWLEGESAAVSPDLQEAWEEAGQEALRLTIGNEADDRILRRKLDALSLKDRDWILIGGPPCQAYSVAGRARNKGVKGYVPHKDERHFLYREYLKIIQEYRPAIFVMENVKGILSSSIKGHRIFHQILRDLSRPDGALGRNPTNLSYAIHSLSEPEFVFEPGMEPAEFDSNAFTVYAENHGIPQQRHRVFLVGVRTDLCQDIGGLTVDLEPSLSFALGGLPPIRSRLSREKDSEAAWKAAVESEGKRIRRLARTSGMSELVAEIDAALVKVSGSRFSPGGQILQGPANWPRKHEQGRFLGLVAWLKGRNIEHIFNHEARAHMRSDLGRYLFASCFARANGRTPKARDFSLEGLSPAHRNWDSGHFDDRFRVQVANDAATTVTSHIAKDGHYYIHPDPFQCRSLTVREAARIQTFPDDYVFLGARTQQYKQVGNAVPPFLARQIARLLVAALRPRSDGVADLRPHGPVGALEHEATMV